MTKKGFTLIELLVVVSIISLLSSIVLAALSDSRDKAKLASARETLRNIKIEGELYLLDNGGKYLPENEPSKENTNCPSNPDPNFGFLGYAKTVQMLRQIHALTGFASRCSVNSNSWAISTNIGNLVSYNNDGLVEKAYAATSGYICMDNAGNFTYAVDPSGSANYANQITLVQGGVPGGLFRCKTN